MVSKRYLTEVSVPALLYHATGSRSQCLLEVVRGDVGTGADDAELAAACTPALNAFYGSTLGLPQSLRSMAGAVCT